MILRHSSLQPPKEVEANVGEIKTQNKLSLPHIESRGRELER